MELSFFLAKVMGLYLVLVVLAVAMNRKEYLKMLPRFIKNRSMSMLAGVFTLILGLLVVVSHNIWESDWTVLVTLTGWLTLVKGAMYLFFPDAIMRLGKKFNSKTAYAVWTPIGLLWGGFLIYMGFFY
tara:strand:- start:183 stop:566 length:384 start_codon:yes stop_codon:yes gene_type:complete